MEPDALQVDEASEDSRLMPMIHMSFVGINGEYSEEDFEIGQAVKFTVSGFVRKVGVEKLEDEDSPSRPFMQVKITGLTRIG